MSTVENKFIQAVSKDTPSHKKCRNSEYIGDKIDAVQTVRFHSFNEAQINLIPYLKRAPVPDDAVTFDVEFEDYSPVEFTSKNVLGPEGKKPVWADPPET